MKRTASGWAERMGNSSKSNTWHYYKSVTTKTQRLYFHDRLLLKIQSFGLVNRSIPASRQAGETSTYGGTAKDGTGCEKRTRQRQLVGRLLD